ncbi:MAG: carbohydrate ABC transporter permease [Firmicutes bacterium]|jgi:ABC-type glycerol-3-phosphate transport system permease component|nr:carbohydrate ABC transporter permease [Bacillota bacterium]
MNSAGHKRQNRGVSRLGTVFLLCVLTVVALVYLIPLCWTVASALRPASSLYEYANPLTWRTFVPDRVTLANLQNIFVNLGFGRALANSFIVAVASIVLGVAVNSMAGFALAKFQFPGKGLLFFMVLITFMVPFEAIVIPLYLVVSRLGIINSYYALILPAVGNGLAIFLFKQFFEEVPSELLEAARVDGASWMRIFWGIVMPLSMPVVVSVVVMLFMFQWNALFWPLVAAHSSQYQMVQVAVATHVTAEEAHWANLFSSALAASLPPMLLFLFLQKYYVRGISNTGFK